LLDLKNPGTEGWEAKYLLEEEENVFAVVLDTHFHAHRREREREEPFFLGRKRGWLEHGLEHLWPVLFNDHCEWNSEEN
jgi:hypothetical protein